MNGRSRCAASILFGPGPPRPPAAPGAGGKLAGRIEATSKVRGLVDWENAATDHASPAMSPAERNAFMTTNLRQSQCIPSGPVAAVRESGFDQMP